MSINESKIIVCPHCQHEQTIQIWQSLNVSLDKDAKKDLFEGKINLMECEKCHQKTLVPVPLLYHDPARKYAVQYYPTAIIRNEQFLSQFKIDGTYAGDQDIQLEAPDYMRRLHIVFNMNELVTYIVFREVLADYHLTGKVMLN